jgi:methyl-accepting chemotaxis protein
MIKDGYDVKRVHKVSVITTFSIIFLSCLQSLLGGFSVFIEFVTPAAIILAITLINYFLPIKDYVKGCIFSLVPAIVIIAFFYIDGFSLDGHYILFCAIALASLYFNKKILIINAAIIDVSFITVFLLTPDRIMGSDNNLQSFTSTVIVLNGTIALLYLLTKWGRKLIDDSYQKQLQAEELLAKLQATFNEVEHSTGVLEDSISKLYGNISAIKEESQNITASMNDMANSIQEEATSTNTINESMFNSLEIAKETLDISKGIISKTDELNQTFVEGWSQIEQMHDQMSIIGSSITTANSTVTELQSSMKTINDLLADITNIASQTNLLALNAAIESARAGEQGKGFSVVADEVRKLAEQSAKIAANITQVTTGIFNKCREASEKVSNGEIVAKEGQELIKSISNYFNYFKQSFGDTNSEISRGMEKIENVTDLFTSTQRQIQNMADISQQNAAATEEVLATTENENKELQEIFMSINTIKELSGQLMAIVKK